MGPGQGRLSTGFRLQEHLRPPFIKINNAKIRDPKGLRKGQLFCTILHLSDFQHLPHHSCLPAVCFPYAFRMLSVCFPYASSMQAGFNPVLSRFFRGFRVAGICL
jgi:hypothetical protein